jgi:UDP-glucose 4-epimerase
MSARPLEGKRILITGGTGSVGKVLTQRILREELGCPEEIVIFSRDEAKQHFMRLAYQNLRVATDEVIYKHKGKVRFLIGDVRDRVALNRALQGVHVVFATAALKQVPTCEYYPFEAVKTNVEGVKNLLDSIYEHRWPVELVLGISTDKAVKPVNVMGMSKAIQERLIQTANTYLEGTRCVCVRYGNVLASRGSVIPLFHEQIRAGGPVTLTAPDMTRFFLTLNDAVDTIFAAVREAKAGETYIPRVPAARMPDVAEALIGRREVEVKFTGVRPGEKIHEILISEEEVARTHDRGSYYAISSILPEVNKGAFPAKPVLKGEYSSSSSLMSRNEVRAFLERAKLTLEDVASEKAEELLR